MIDIVYIDDDPDGFMALTKDEKDRTRISAFIFEPDTENTDAFDAAATANVWLLDFFLLDASHDKYKDENGLSLLQKWKARLGSRPTTVVLSSDLAKAVGEPLGPVERHHVIAQRHGVEWIGDKSMDTLRRVIDLADAVTCVAKALKPSNAEGTEFGTFEAEQLCFNVLGAPSDAEWANSAQRQIDRARPPREVPVLPEAAKARPIVSWLVAHTLPYPSFLLTDAQAALRLKITPASFRSLATTVEQDNEEDRYRLKFAACRYGGPLATFLGRRWWRAGIDDLAWHLSQHEYQSSLEKLAGESAIEWLPQSEPVLLSNADLVETDDVAEAGDCVRVTDEDFPANVDPAWVLIESARQDKQLAAKVVYEDRELLSTVE